jgi:ATP-dependent exoDNAse (exonuclease V) beta subunit
VWRTFAVSLHQYQRTLDAHALVDFPGVLEHAVKLLSDMDEFARSRYRLESRYRHVLVDEFQDTSRAQWELVSQLVKTWGEGLGAGSDALPPSIFIVGDRKQSIYGFRDADVAVLDAAAAFVAGLRGEGDPRRAISVSFRAAPELLAFVNDLFDAIVGADRTASAARRDAFRYEEPDRFPTPAGRTTSASPLGLVVAESMTAAAGRVAEEIEELLGNASVTVRDRGTRLHRRVRPADVAVLFRSRDSHREFEKALEARGIPTYVYKGLGFFEADEVQDVVALVRYLADPLSNLRAASLLRSRIVRLSDAAIARLSPGLAEALISPEQPHVDLTPDDRAVLTRLRTAIPGWLSGVDRVPPTALVRAILAETAYAYETRGPRRLQARENLKMLRAMMARFENHGYATLARVAEHLEQLAVGDESNATLDARDSVSLMTVHAAKGLEFPIVFVVNLGRGTGGVRAPIRVATDGAGEPSVAIADFQSEADDDAQARDREETKRLLYVALTRARDRLYLSTTVQSGTCRMGRGSLGEVLPASMRAMFQDAAAGRPVEWPGCEGRVHRFSAQPHRT